jgi:hypothetical protein
MRHRAESQGYSEEAIKTKFRSGILDKNQDGAWNLSEFFHPVSSIVSVRVDSSE